MKLTKFRKVILIIGAVLAVLFLLISYHPGASGTVVDAETEKPIEGAVVMVEWTKTKGLPGLTYHQVHKIVEVETNKKGKFSVWATFHPLAGSPTIVIYKKGYVAWSDRIVFPGSKNRTDVKWKINHIFRLEKFKPEYNHNDHILFIHSAIGSGRGKKPLIKNAYEWEAMKALEERKKSWRK